MSKVVFGILWPGGVIFINLISPISILSKDKEILILLSIFPQQPIEQREQHMEQNMFGCIEVLNKDEEENVVAGQERHRVRTQVITRLRCVGWGKNMLQFYEMCWQKTCFKYGQKLPNWSPMCNCTWPNSRPNVRNCGAFFSSRNRFLKIPTDPGSWAWERKKVGHSVLVQMQSKHCKIDW